MGAVQEKVSFPRICRYVTVGAGLGVKKKEHVLKPRSDPYSVVMVSVSD